jgi:hypothetical protein
VIAMSKIIIVVVVLGLLLYYQQTQAKIITFKSGVTLNTNGSFSEQVGKLTVGSNLSLLEAGIIKAGNVVDTCVSFSSFVASNKTLVNACNIAASVVYETCKIPVFYNQFPGICKYNIDDVKKWITENNLTPADTNRIAFDIIPTLVK